MQKTRYNFIDIEEISIKSDTKKLKDYQISKVIIVLILL